MSKKSFIEEELANEAKVRTKSQKQSLSQRFARLLHKDKPDISPKPKTPLTSSVYTRLAEDAAKCGLILTLNEIRESYEYPTMSDGPQSAGIVVRTKLQNVDGDEIEAPIYFMSERV